MVQPQRSDAAAAERSERLSRAIREHIAKGNKPNHAFAQKKMQELNAMVSSLGPAGLTEEQIDLLVDESCGRRNILKDWPVVRIDDDEFSA